MNNCIFNVYFRKFSKKDDNNLSYNPELEQNKNVTFFIGEEKISIISFISDFKYKRNTLKEYKKWNQEELKQVKARTFYKHFEYLNEIIPNLEEVKLEKQIKTYKTR